MDDETKQQELRLLIRALLLLQNGPLTPRKLEDLRSLVAVKDRDYNVAVALPKS